MQSHKETDLDKDKQILYYSFFFGDEITKSDLVFYCYNLLDFLMCNDYWQTQNTKLKDTLPEPIIELQNIVSDFMKSEFRYKGSYDKFSSLRAFFNSVDNIIKLLARLRAKASHFIDYRLTLIESCLDNSVGKSVDAFFDRKITKSSLQRFLIELANLDLTNECVNQPDSPYWEQKNKDLVSFISSRDHMKKIYKKLEEYFGGDNPTWNYLNENKKEIKKRNNHFGFPEHVQKKSKKSIQL